MQVTGKHLSLFGRAALSTVGGSRTSLRGELDPLQATYPLKDLTSSQYRELHDLEQGDREVRQHEQAQIAAGGAQVRGGASYSYRRGPAARQYAVGGEVQRDTAPVPGDSAAPIRKMQAVKSAALAPAEPSAQDRAVAADAAQAENRARAELRESATSADNGAQTAGTSTRASHALAAYRSVDTAQSGIAASPVDLMA